MPAILDDVRYALRQFRKAPGFTLTAILTLALGIGATTAIFTLIHAVLLKSLPVENPSELVRVGDIEACCVNTGLPSFNDKTNDWALFSTAQYQDFLNRTPEFRQLAAFQATNPPYGVRRQGSGHPAEALTAETVSGNAFPTLGIAPYTGRLLTPDDDRKGAPPVAVMSFRTWQQKFGQDPSVVGSTFEINGQPFTIVGIAPPGFYGERLTSNPPAFWLPLADEPLITGVRTVLDHPEAQWLVLFGRLQPGATMRQTEVKMQAEMRQWLSSPASLLRASSRALIPRQTLRLTPGGGGVQRMQENYKTGLELLMAVSAFVLLLACANLANLMLVRSASRVQQTSVRTALGAPRARLVRQALTESITLSVLGGAAGLVVAFAATRLILRLAFAKASVPPVSAAPSLPVLAFAFAVALLTGVLFGVAPAWMASHADPVEALRGANRSTGQSGNATRKALVIAQVAISLLLLSGAGLLAGSLRNLQHQDFGFQTKDRYILQIDPQMAGYKLDQMDAFTRRLRETLGRIPGVADVSIALHSPMDGNNWGTDVDIEGQPPSTPDNPNAVTYSRVSADYFKSIGSKIVEGRPVAEEDTPSTRTVAVVNQAFVKKFLKNEDPLGKHFGNSSSPGSAGRIEIVGVVQNAKYNDPAGPVTPMYFVAAPQHTVYTTPQAAGMEDNSMYMGSVQIRTNGYVVDLEAQVRRALAQVNPNLSVISFQTFADQVTARLNQQTMVATLTSLFGLLALVLASIGLYGVTAYSVERRTSEIGLRMALGADRSNVLRLVLRGAFLQVAVGLAIGIPAAIFAGHLMATQLFGIRPYDPLVLLGTTLVLSTAAFLAAAVPARRAASVEPMQALRME